MVFVSSVKGKCKFKTECFKNVHCYSFNGTYFVNNCIIMTDLLVQTQPRLILPENYEICCKISFTSL